jgi:cytochrome c2
MHNRFAKIATTVVVTMVLVLGAALAFAEDAPKAPEAKKDHAYVGTKACKMCHNSEAQGKIFDKWMSTKHAKSMAALDATKGQDKDPKCLKCHTVLGYEKAAADMQTPETLGAVGCEACHGAGADYKAMGVMKDHAASLAAGMVVPTEETCKKCHNAESPTFKGFDYAKALPMIAHGKKTEAKPAEEKK